ncbi:polysaccharide biosynthesis/export family protein [Neomegalonema sp.]|uniref:polysaccharide biosynthesis/export family protein n=1 Tax=Neomegalonema sp. TaxID=2039713 RepID=UPI00262BD401|nr:polysaccharide biosynthesis/export family protein [Neomegalonema sp.]MDD2867521.1 polysaccharide export protein [Neomegalonema sp.]
MIFGRFMAAAVFAAMALAGCEKTPRGGPLAWEISDAAVEGQVAYDLIPVDADVARLARIDRVYAMPPDYIRTAPEDYAKIAPGEELSIRIWENIDEGVFTSVGARNSEIGAVTVDEVGQIFVPYVGFVDAAGRSVSDLRREIRASLAEKTLDPQIEIRRAKETPRSVSIQGVVSSPGVYPLSPGEDTMMRLLARAGGSTLQPEVTFVTLRRRGQSIRLPLSVIYATPRYDVTLVSGDTLILERDPRFYTAMGAVRGPGRREFSGPDMTLMDALGASGGLNDDQANPTGVFVYRFEEADRLARYRFKRIMAPDDPTPVDATGIETLALPSAAIAPGLHRVIYQLDMRRPDALFYAKAFQLREDDLIFVTNAPIVEWRKIMSLISMGTGAVSTAGGTATTLGVQ